MYILHTIHTTALKIGLFSVLSTLLTLQRCLRNQSKRHVCAHAKNEEKGPKRTMTRAKKRDSASFCIVVLGYCGMCFTCSRRVLSWMRMCIISVLGMSLVCLARAFCLFLSTTVLFFLFPCALSGHSNVSFANPWYQTSHEEHQGSFRLSDAIPQPATRTIPRMGSGTHGGWLSRLRMLVYHSFKMSLYRSQECPIQLLRNPGIR